MKTVYIYQTPECSIVEIINDVTGSAISVQPNDYLDFDGIFYQVIDVIRFVSISRDPSRLFVIVVINQIDNPINDEVMKHITDL